MKKIMATLLFASMILSGCGNNAANNAQQKVEQKAEEVKQDANQKVEEVKQDAKNAAAAVENKTEEVKQDATQVVQNVLNLIDATKSLFKDSRDVTLAGALPGIALDKLIEAFGAPVTRNGDELTFSNGMQIDIDDVKNIVEKIVIRTPDIMTPEGVGVGMDEGILNTAYGPADKVDVESDGVDYEYFNKDKTRSITFKSQGGIITEIESEIHD